jgi:hypothetical protein
MTRIDYDNGWAAVRSGERYRPIAALVTPDWASGFAGGLRDHLLDPTRITPLSPPARAAIQWQVGEQLPRWRAAQAEAAEQVRRAAEQMHRQQQIAGAVGDALADGQ